MIFQIHFLDNGSNYREKISILYSKLLSNSIFIDIELGLIDNKGLYNDSSFEDIRINLKYNISN